MEKTSDLIILIALIVVILIMLLLTYEPKLDIISSSNKISIYLWYNKYVGEEKKRVYVKLF